MNPAKLNAEVFQRRRVINQGQSRGLQGSINKEGFYVVAKEEKIYCFFCRLFFGLF